MNQVLQKPNLTFIYFQIKNFNQIIKHRLLPIKALLKHGVRFVRLEDPLQDENLQLNAAKLFLNINTKKIK